MVIVAGSVITCGFMMSCARRINASVSNLVEL
jgi:hypothetical protein